MDIVISFSGGLDSTTLAYFLRSKGHHLRCLSLEYGQKHSCELDSAKILTKIIGVEHKRVDLSAIKPILGNNALTAKNTKIPKGHYNSETMKSTIVPNRNMLFLAMSITWAISTSSNAIAYAAHTGDHTIYPDCRPEFIDAMRKAASLCDWTSIDIITPFSDKSKADIVRLGNELGVPFEKTWSCYLGGKIHCGECGTCVERKEAFKLSGITDPTIYKN